MSGRTMRPGRFPAAEKHTYVDVRFVQFLPSCSCGWRTNTPTSDEKRARDLWEYHRNRVHKGEAR